jgi:hypothetical protein
MQTLNKKIIIYITLGIIGYKCNPKGLNSLSALNQSSSSSPSISPGIIPDPNIATKQAEAALILNKVTEIMQNGFKYINNCLNNPNLHEIIIYFMNWSADVTVDHIKNKITTQLEKNKTNDHDLIVKSKLEEKENRNKLVGIFQHLNDIVKLKNKLDDPIPSSESEGYLSEIKNHTGG